MLINYYGRCVKESNDMNWEGNCSLGVFMGVWLVILTKAMDQTEAEMQPPYSLHYKTKK